MWDLLRGIILQFICRGITLSTRAGTLFFSFIFMYHYFPFLLLWNFIFFFCFSQFLDMWIWKQATKSVSRYTRINCFLLVNFLCFVFHFFNLKVYEKNLKFCVLKENKFECIQRPLDKLNEKKNCTAANLSEFLFRKILILNFSLF